MQSKNSQYMELTAVIDGLVAALAGSADGARYLTEGRAVQVMASPGLGNSTKTAVGISVLPPDYETVAHSHEAEEIAYVVRGQGVIVIDGVEHPVSAGSVVVTPSNSSHVTRSTGSEELAVFWVYAPAGSEGRWMKN